LSLLPADTSAHKIRGNRGRLGNAELPFGEIGAICNDASFSLAATAPFGFAQEPAVKGVPNRVFQQFDVVQKLRLGATVLVNPNVAADSMVVYSLDIKPLSGQAETRVV
jgi:hypothetical protein